MRSRGDFLGDATLSLSREAIVEAFERVERILGRDIVLG